MTAPLTSDLFRRWLLPASIVAIALGLAAATASASPIRDASTTPGSPISDTSTTPTSPIGDAPTALGGAGSMVLRIAMGLGFVVVLLYGGARFVLPRLQGLAGAARSEIGVVARATLGGRRAVVLVRTRGRTYLVGVTDHAISLIDEVDGRSRSAVDPSRDVVDAVRGGVR